MKEYKDKLTELNLPIFQKGRSVSKPAGNSSEKNVKTSEDEHASTFYSYSRDGGIEEEDG